MSENPFVLHYEGCRRCHDVGMVEKFGRAVPCPNCGVAPGSGEKAVLVAQDGRRASRDVAYWRAVAPATLTVLDLTDEEFEILKRWQEGTGLPKEKLLVWMEGLRYDPSKDPEVQRAVMERITPLASLQTPARAQRKGKSR